MLQWLSDFLNQNGFVPHGVCLLWRPELLWTHVVADSLIALAYFVIPLRLLTLAQQRRDFGYRGSLILFVAFILLCGLTHLIGMVTVWQPIYGIEAIVKSLTAVVSVATAVWMIPLIPRLLSIPSPAQMAIQNRALESALGERDALLIELHAHRNRLESLVAERTAALQASNQSLAATNRNLERSNRELEHFAYVASHDLQEPVRKILTFLDLARPLLRVEPDSKAEGYLSRIEAAAQRMHRLIQDLLSLSRVANQAIERETVDLRASLDEACADLGESLRGAQATVTITGTWPTIDANATLVRQLFANLIDNAVKFRRAEVPLQLNIEASRAANGEIVLRFLDNGRGFDSQDARHLFRLFRRLSAEREVGGTGIGLALCRKVVDFLGGSIEANGTPGVGATFVITLPEGLIRG